MTGMSNIVFLGASVTQKQRYLYFIFRFVIINSSEFSNKYPGKAVHFK